MPFPLCDGDTVGGEERNLDPKYIHFSCYCGYVFARQCGEEFKERAERWGFPHENWRRIKTLNYPTRDLQGGILPPIDSNLHCCVMCGRIEVEP